MSCVEKTIVVPGFLEVEHGVLEDFGIDGVEARKRLVEDQELRLVEHRRDELDLLGHPLRQAVDLLVDPGGKPQPFEPLVDRAVELWLPSPP